MRSAVITSTWISTALGCAFTALLGVSPSVGQLPSPGELIYPSKGINENIDHLQQALQSLIDKFGKTVDEQTLKALQRAMAGVQSLRIAYADALNNTLEGVGAQRAALLYQSQAQLQELEKFLNGQVNILSETEQRFSRTLIDIMRADPVPLVLTYGPALFRPDQQEPLVLTISGQNLGNVKNSLSFGYISVDPSESTSNRSKFVVPRKLLDPDQDGFVKAKFRAIRYDTSVFAELFSWFGHTPIKSVDFLLLLRPLGSNVGAYEVDTDYPPPSSPFEMKNSDPWIDTTPNNVEHCLMHAEGQEFDPAYTKITVTKNTISAPEHEERPSQNDPLLRNIVIKVPARTISGPAEPSKLTINAPDKICFTTHSPAAAPAVSTVETVLTYRVHYLVQTPLKFHESGILLWEKDKSITLPRGFNGFRVSMAFTNGEQRVFTSPAIYGPLQITFDPNSRAIVLRPISQN